VREPRRWLDDDSDAPEGTRALLRHARKTPPIDRRALSLSAALIAKLAVSPSTAAALPLAAKVVASLSLIGVATFAGVELASPPPSTPDARRSAPAVHQHARPPELAKHDRPVSIEATQGGVPLPAGPSDPNHDHPESNEQLEGPKSAVSSHAAARSEPGDMAPAAEGAAEAAAALPPETTAPKVPTPRAQRTNAPAARPATPPDGRVAKPDAPEPTVDEDSLARELHLLDQARARLPHDPAGALRALEQHAQQFPRAMLGAERELMAIDALQRAGRTAQAEQRAARFEQRFSGTMYRARLRAIMHRPR
jgi:hypothetical protein